MSDTSAESDVSTPASSEPIIARAARRQRRTFTIIMSVSLLFFTLILVTLFGSQSGPRPDMGWFEVILVVAIGFNAVMMIYVNVRVRRWWSRVEALVPNLEGMVCPKCALATRATNEAGVVRCPRCERRFDMERLRDVWGVVAACPSEAARASREAVVKGGERSHRVSRMVEWMFLEPKGRIVFAVAMCLIAGAVVGPLTGDSVFWGALGFVPWMLIMCGAMLIGSGFKSRVGASTRCSSCGYQRAPDARMAQPLQCPECAAPWNQIGGTMRGEFKRRPAVLLAGILCIVAGFMLTRHSTGGANWQTWVMPTGVLIDRIATERYARAEWAELNARQLTTAQTHALAEALLDQRLHEGVLDDDPENWFIAQIQAGTLNASTVKRFYGEAIDIWLIAPTHASVNETITIAIGTRCRPAYSSNPGPVVLVGGYAIDHAKETIERQVEAIEGRKFGHIRLVRNEDLGPGDGPVIKTAAKRAGPLRVELELWIAYAPMNTVHEITWNDNGTPVTPAGAVHMEHRTVEHVIEVTE